MNFEPRNVSSVVAPTLDIAIVGIDGGASGVGHLLQQAGMRVRHFDGARCLADAVTGGDEYAAVFITGGVRAAREANAAVDASGPVVIWIGERDEDSGRAADALLVGGFAPADIWIEAPVTAGEIHPLIRLIHRHASLRRELGIARLAQQAAVRRSRCASETLRHDVRCALTTASRLSGELTRLEKLTPTERQHLDLLRGTIDSAARRAEAAAGPPDPSNRLDLEREPVGLRRLVAEALTHCGFEQDLASWTPSTVDPIVAVDPVEFRRVLENLILNVRCHADGAPRIEVSVETEQVIIDVSDRGVGLSDDIEVVTAREPGGGLAYAMSVVRAHGGRIETAMRPGGGLRVRTGWPAPERLEPLARPATAPSEVEGMCIWLVDDEQLFLRATGRLLKLWNHEVRSFERGGDVLAALPQADSPPDLILCDSDMPSISGLDVLRRVRSIAPDITRVLFTAHAPDSTVVQAFNQGIVHRFLQKGDGPTALRACLEALAQELKTIGVSNKQKRDSKLRADLEDLLDRRAVKYHLQPLFSTEKLEVVGCEALMRSCHPSFRGPLEILDAASAFHREVALQRVLSDLAREAREALPECIRLLINLDPVLLHTDAHLDEGLHRLYPVAEGCVLELTERAQLGTDHSWIAAVQKLRLQGFRIALDDVGAGYNGLGAVAALQPDIIKLDISLVSGLHEDARKSEIVGLLCNYARAHNLLTIAEGIEEEAEAVACTSIGVNWLQGFHLARPMPIARLVADFGVKMRTAIPDWAHD